MGRRGTLHHAWSMSRAAGWRPEAATRPPTESSRQQTPMRRWPETDDAFHPRTGLPTAGSATGSRLSSGPALMRAGGTRRRRYAATPTRWRHCRRPPTGQRSSRPRRRRRTRSSSAIGSEESAVGAADRQSPGPARRYSSEADGRHRLTTRSPGAASSRLGGSREPSASSSRRRHLKGGTTTSDGQEQLRGGGDRPREPAPCIYLVAARRVLTRRQTLSERDTWADLLQPGPRSAAGIQKGRW